MRNQSIDPEGPAGFDVRRATVADVDAMAAAHIESIRSIGPRYYDAETVRAWGARVTGQMYLQAMAAGELFFVAVAARGDAGDVLGFSSHRVDEGEHGTSVYVRGNAARRGVGTALLRAAEASARAAGAASIEIDASLAAVDFYRANGFDETGRGEHLLSPGAAMACVFMRKPLRPREDAHGLHR